MDTQALKYQQAFTLIELMMVIAIIGILAAIAIPAYQNQMAKAQVTEAVILIDGLKSVVTENFTQTGHCPDNVTGVDSSVTPATEVNGKYVLRVETGGIASPISGNCTITAIMKPAGVFPAIQGAKIKLTMSTFNSSSIGWLCLANIEQKYVPLVCGYSSF